MLSLDLSLLWTIINILVLFLLLKKFLFKPVVKIMDERAALIQKDLDDAASSKKEANELKTGYEQTIKNAHNEAVDITDKAKQRAQAECDVMLKDAKVECDRIIENAHKSIETERAKVLGDARYEIADLAVLAAAKVVARNTDKESDKKIAESFLSEVGAKQ